MSQLQNKCIYKNHRSSRYSIIEQNRAALNFRYKTHI